MKKERAVFIQMQKCERARHKLLHTVKITSEMIEDYDWKKKILQPFHKNV